MDECQILALLCRVAEAARIRPDQVRPRVHGACEAALQSSDQMRKSVLRCLVLGNVRCLLHEPAELAGFLPGQVQADDRSVAGPGLKNSIENPRRLDVGNQEVALLRGQLDHEVRLPPVGSLFQARSLLAPSNEMRIPAALMLAPTQINASTAWPLGAPRPSGGPARPACRLHARVRRRGQPITTSRQLAALGDTSVGQRRLRPRQARRRSSRLARREGVGTAQIQAY